MDTNCFSQNLITDDKLNNFLDNISNDPKEDNENFLKERKFIKSSISQLSENEHIEIFKIIRDETDKFTENNNGIFINLSKLSNPTIIKIVDFINYCINNKTLLDLDKKKRESIIEIVNSKEREINSETEEEDEEEDEINYINTEIMNGIEKDIVSSSLSGDKYKINEKKIKYTGSRAKIIKKCKEYKGDDANIIEETI